VASAEEIGWAETAMTSSVVVESLSMLSLHSSVSFEEAEVDYGSSALIC
jgi:hypothetical protein